VTTLEIRCGVSPRRTGCVSVARTRTAGMVALESDTENVEVGRIDVTA
jgi:hypothetical protein